LGISWFEASLGKYFARPYLQNNQSKWSGDMTQMIERLLCKHKVLSLNLSQAKIIIIEKR
jgi:hypothetical protein